MSKKRIKKRSLKNLKSFIGSEVFKKKIEVVPTDLLKNTKNKIKDFYEDYKKNKEKEKK